MVTNVILLSYVFLLLFAIGVLGKMFFTKISFTENSPIDETPADHYILFGFILLTFTLSVISIFSKIGLTVHLLIFALTFTGVVRFRKKYFSLVNHYLAYLKQNRNV